METARLTVEVHFVPLPPQEAEERTVRLHTLLLRGVLRLARQDHDQNAESPVSETVQK